MNIILIGPFPPPMTGVSIANKTVCEYLPDAGNYSIKIIDTNISQLKEDIGRFSLKKVFYFSKQYLLLYKILMADKVYMTIGQTFWGVMKYLPFFVMSKVFRREIITHIHGNYVWQEYNELKGLKRKIYHKILSLTDKGIVLSYSLKKNFYPFISENKIFVLENFVEDILFSSNILDKEFKELRIIYLSNLMEEKGIIDLLDALMLLKKRGIPFKAKIAGGIDIVLKEKIDFYLNKLIDDVKYLNVVSGKNKKEMLEWGNIFVFPTYYSMEGQPISIFEAMATGNIILTTKHAGIPDVFVENINGFFIKKRSPESIADKLLKLNEGLHNFKHISEHNIKEAKRKYRVRTFIDKLNKIIVV